MALFEIIKIRKKSLIAIVYNHCYHLNSTPAKSIFQFCELSLSFFEFVMSQVFCDYHHQDNVPLSLGHYTSKDGDYLLLKLEIREGCGMQIQLVTSLGDF